MATCIESRLSGEAEQLENVLLIYLTAGSKTDQWSSSVLTEIYYHVDHTFHRHLPDNDSVQGRPLGYLRKKTWNRPPREWLCK